MSGEVRFPIVGNMTDTPVLGFTKKNVPVTNFTIAVTERAWDREAGEMRDGETVFIRCTAWRTLAENICGSLTKGARVVAIGKLQQRKYESEDGKTLTSTELRVDSVGPDLLWATAQITRMPKPDAGRSPSFHDAASSYAGGFDEERF